jgi:hypothetical protein
MALTLPEEILLLMLDDATGQMVDGADHVADLALAAAVLMDLALRGRIDSDQEHLFLADPAPTGDAVLDEALGRIAAVTAPHTSREWIEALSAEAPVMRERLFERLAYLGILRPEGLVFTWEGGGRSLGKDRGEEEREVKARLIETLLGDDIPDARDALLIGLADATGLLRLTMPPAFLDAAGERIATVARLEEMNRALNRAVRAARAGMLDAG